MTIIVQVASTATNLLYNGDILNWVMPDVPQAPMGVVNNAIRDSVIELCERALIWRTELPEILVLGPTSTETTAAASEGDTSVVVDSITDFNANDTITVDLTDGTKWRGHVSGTPAGSTIHLDGQLNNDVDSGAAVTKLVYIYPMTMPENAVIAKGLKAWINDSVIEPISPDDLDNEFNNTEFGWVGTNWRTDINLPTRWFIDSGDTNVQLALAPATTGNLRVLAALKPTRASTTMPTWLFERYIETIAHGAKARLMLSPRKPFSDMKLGAYHMEMFNGLIGEARIRAARGTTRAPLRSHSVFGLR